MPKIMDWADKFAEGEFPTQREMIREAITDPEHPYYNFIRHLPATFTAQDAGQQNTVTNWILLMTRLMTLSVRGKSLVFTYTFTQVENRWFVRKIWSVFVRSIPIVYSFVLQMQHWSMKSLQTRCFAHVRCWRTRKNSVRWLQSQEHILQTFSLRKR